MATRHLNKTFMVVTTRYHIKTILALHCAVEVP